MKIAEKYRLYARQWMLVHTISERWRDEQVDIREVVELARQWAEERFSGKIYNHDIRLRAEVDNAHRPTRGTVFIEVLTDNLIGEYPDKAACEMMAKIKGLEEYTVVQCGSAADKTIRERGYVIL